MNTPTYKNGSLHCEDMPLDELAKSFGTPLYVYSYKQMSDAYKALDQALEGLDHKICLAVKALDNLAILSVFKNLGAGADIVSGGELFRCHQAGFAMSDIVFSGVGKTVEEMEYAISRNVGMFAVESEAEFEQLAQVALRMQKSVRVGFRLNPNVDPKTHPYIATGLHSNKFGMPIEQLRTLYPRAKQADFIEPVALTMHIGSQITDLTPFREAANIALAFVDELAKQGIELSALDLGGGLGVSYEGQEVPSMQAFGDMLKACVGDRKIELRLEPGRSMVAEAGMLLSKVLFEKQTSQKRFVVVDAGMNDLLRPSLYQAHHPIMPLRKSDAATSPADVVGPVCESGDFQGKDVPLPSMHAGDYLCIAFAGAYGSVMSSRYNSRPRVAEVLVRGGDVDVIRKREGFDDLVANEQIPKWLDTL